MHAENRLDPFNDFIKNSDVTVIAEVDCQWPEAVKICNHFKISYIPEIIKLSPDSQRAYYFPKASLSNLFNIFDFTKTDFDQAFTQYPLEYFIQLQKEEQSWL